MTDDLKKEIKGFVENCRKMDWDNVSNLIIFLENSLMLLEKTIKENKKNGRTVTISKV